MPQRREVPSRTQGSLLSTLCFSSRLVQSTFPNVPSIASKHRHTVDPSYHPLPHHEALFSHSPTTRTCMYMEIHPQRTGCNARLQMTVSFLALSHGLTHQLQSTCCRDKHSLTRYSISRLNRETTKQPHNGRKGTRNWAMLHLIAPYLAALNLPDLPGLPRSPLIVAGPLFGVLLGSSMSTLRHTHHTSSKLSRLSTTGRHHPDIRFSNHSSHLHTSAIQGHKFEIEAN